MSALLSVPVIALAALCGPAVPTAAAAPPTSAATTGYDRDMLAELAGTLHTKPAEAARLLQAQRSQSEALKKLHELGVASDGAFFVGDRLVVNVAGPAAEVEARRLGLTPRRGTRGERELVATMAAVARVAGTDLAEVQSYGPDLPGQRVVVTVNPDATRGMVDRLTAIAGVRVQTGTRDGLAPRSEVVPGRIMDLQPGSNCSLGFAGSLASGNNVLLTAGHCVEGLPDVLNENGVHIGRGIRTRFRTGARGVDMGLMDIDAEDTGRGYVDTRAGRTVRVSGSSKAPVGSAICKAGNTTGWTCGRIQAYGVTVNYQGGTTVSGLAQSSVCSEGGDSGGAYISGTLAQGMTSGGPVNGPDCGFSPGPSPAGSLSYYQPVVDAANYYGVTLTTS